MVYVCSGKIKRQRNNFDQPISNTETHLGSKGFRDLFCIESLEQRVLLSGDGLLPLSPVDASLDVSSIPSIQSGFDSLSSEALPEVAADSVTDMFANMEAQDVLVLEQVEQLVGDESAPDSDSKIDGVVQDTPVAAEGEKFETELPLPGGYTPSLFAGGSLVDQLFTLSSIPQNSSVQSAARSFVLSASPIVINSSASFAGTQVYNDSVLIHGSVTLEAGTGGAGGIQFGNNAGHLLDGDGVVGADVLTLTAHNGNVVVYGNVGSADPLEGLVVTEAVNVTFKGEVVMSGDLEIHASGTVTFEQGVVVNGGNLRILGAGLIVVKGVVVNGGGVLLFEGDEINLTGGEESVGGTGVLTFRPATVNLPVEVGSPPGTDTNSLNVTDLELLSLKDGFASIVFGRADGFGHALAGQGSVKLGVVRADQSNSFADPLYVYGSSIEVADYTAVNRTFQTGSNITLDAVGDITIKNTFLTTADLVLYSEAGQVRQVDDGVDAVSREALTAANLTVRADDGINLGFLQVGTVVTAVNKDTGDLVLNELNTGGDIRVLDVRQTKVAGTGRITVTAEAGNIDIDTAGTGIATVGTGNIVVTAAGTLKAITVERPVTGTTGNINLTATGTVTTSAVVSTSGAGNISVTSSAAGIVQGADVTTAGGTVTYNAAGGIAQNANISSGGGVIGLTAGTNLVMQDGVTTTSAGAAGTIGLTAGTNVLLSILSTGGTVSVTATAGSITDNLTGEGANILGGTTKAVLVAGAGIGTGAEEVNTTIAELTATVNNSGGIFIEESDALVVSNDSTGIVAGGTDGTVVVVTVNGALTVTGVVTVTGAVGNVRLAAGGAGSNLVLNNGVTASGQVSLAAAAAVQAGAAGDVTLTGAGKTLDVLAAGAVTMADGTVWATNNGDVRVESTAAGLTLGLINAGSAGNVALLALAGDVTDLADANAADVLAAGLLVRTVNLGSAANPVETSVVTLAVNVTGTDLFVNESSDVATGRVSVTAQRVALGGTATPLATQTLDDLTSAGVVVLTTVNGFLTIGDGDSDGTGVSAPGNIYLASGETGDAGEDDADDLTLNGAVVSTGGHITLVAADDLNFGVNGDVTTSAAGKNIDVTAGSDVVMVDGTVLTTNNSDVRVVATAGDLTVGLVTVGTGNVALVAGLSVLNLADSNAADVLAAGLILTAGANLGSGSNWLELTVTTLSSSSGGSSGTFLKETNALILDTVSVSTLKVLTDGTTAGAATTGSQTDVVAGNGGAVSLTTGGDLTINDGTDTDNTGLVATGAGHVLLDVTGVLTVLAGIDGGTGSVSLLATGNITQGSGANTIGDLSTAGNGTLEVKSGGAILMWAGNETVAVNGNVRYEAGTSITLTKISTGGSVALIAGTSVIDHANDTVVDVVAAGLLIVAGGDIGSGSNALETTVTTLSTSSGGTGGTYITETNALVIDTLTVAVNRVLDAGTLSGTQTSSTQADLIATNGGSVVVVTGGDLTVNVGDADDEGVKVGGSGHLRLDVTGNLSLQAGLVTAAGHISVTVTGSVTQGGAANVKGDITSTSGTVDVVAGGAISMFDGNVTGTGNANIRYDAAGSLTVGAFNAGTGVVSLKATTITDSGTSDIDVTAAGLRLEATAAAGAIGTGSAPLQLTVGTVSAQAGTGGLFLSETDDLIVDTVATVVVNRVGLDGTTLTAQNHAAQADLVSGAALVVVTVNGALTVNGGGDATGVTAAGNILVQTGETGEGVEDNADDLVLNAGVVSTGGHISLNVADDLMQGADGDVTTQTAGKTVDVLVQGTILMVDGAVTTANGGDIAYRAVTGDLTVGEFVAGTGKVLLVATAGSLKDTTSDTSTVDVTAAALLLVAGGNIGAGTDLIELQVGTLSSSSGGTGGTFLQETDALLVDSVTVTVNRINVLAGVAGTPAQTQADIEAANGGAVVLVTGGDLTLNEGGDADGRAVLATGAGHVLLAATGNLSVQSVVNAGSGHLSLTATGDVTQGSAVNVTGDLLSSAGTIDVAAGGNIVMFDGNNATTVNANVRYFAAGSLTVAAISVGTGVVSLKATTITDSGTSDIDVTASAVRLEATAAAGAVGEATNHLELTVGTVSAKAGTGGLFLTESDDLIVDTVAAVSVNRIGTDGAVASTPTDAAQADLVSGGLLVTVTVNGSLTVRGGGDATGVTAADNIRLATGETGEGVEDDADDLVLEAGVMSTGGHISLFAADDVMQAVAGDVTAQGTGKTIDVLAASDLEMVDGAVTTSTDGDIRYEATAGNITLGALVAGTGDVAVIAVAGAIVDLADSNAVDVSAAGVLLVAGQNAGEAANHLEITAVTLAAQTVTGLFVAETDALAVNTVTVQVNRIGTTGATPGATTDRTVIDLTVTGTGALVLTAGGTITLNEGGDSDGRSVDVTGTGNVRLESTGGDVVLNGSADVRTAGGNLTVLAAVNVTLAALADLLAPAGTIDVVATAGKVDMADNALISTGAGNGDIRVVAGTNILLGGVNAGVGGGDVSLVAGGNILDNGEAFVDVVAGRLRLEAGGSIGKLGSGTDDDIDVTVGTLAARAGAGGMNLTETDAVTVGTVDVLVKRVNAQGGTDDVTDLAVNLSDLATTADGSIVLQTLNGTITVTDGTAPAGGVGVSANGAGNVLLRANGAAGSLVLDVNADVVSGTGHVSLYANVNVEQKAGADVQTGGGDISVKAVTGTITMADTARAVTSAAAVMYRAAGTVTVGGIAAGVAGTVRLYSQNGSVVDGGDTFKDVVAGGLRIEAANGGVGELAALPVANALETAVGTLAVRAGGLGVSLLEDDALTVGSVSFAVREVQTNATTVTDTPLVLSDVTTGSNGSIVLQTQAGSLTLTDGTGLADGVAVSANGSGNIRLQALDAGFDVIVNTVADIVSGGGHISVLAARDVTFAAGADVTTTGTGTVEVLAGTGSVTQVDDSRFSSGTGAIRVAAQVDIALGGVTTGGNVSLVAVTGAVTDAGSLSGGEDVIAAGLRIKAATGIGTGADALETSVVTLTAQTTISGGVFIRETDTLVVDDVSVTVQQVTASAGVTPVTDVNQSDVVTGGNGSIVIRVVTGNLTLNDGLANDDNVTVSANGTGNILLEALNGSVTGNEDILSGTGHISVLAKNSLTFTTNADLTTGLTGTVELVATTGSISLSPTSHITTGSGHIRLSATTALQDVTLGGVITTTGNVSVLAGRNILDGDGEDTTVDVVASGLWLQAGNAIGQLGGSVNPVETTVTTLTARAGAGGVSLRETDTLVVDDVSVTVQQVTASAGVTPVTDVNQSDVVTGGNGSIVIRVVTGNLTLNDGLANDDNVTVSANGTGNILLEALNGSVTGNEDILSGTGHISVLAKNSLTFTTNADLTTGLTGTVELVATTGSISLSPTSHITTGSGHIRLSATTALQDVTLGGVITTTGNVSVLAGRNILDGDGEDTTVDVVASGLWLQAGNAIGQLGGSVNPVETTVTTLTARAGAGGVSLRETDTLVVDDVSVTVQQVTASAGVTPVTDVNQSDVVTGGNGSIVIRVVTGNLTLNDGLANDDNVTVSANGTGNILLEALNGSVTGNEDILSGTGHISVLAKNSLTFTTNADLTTGLTGTVELVATTGSISLSPTSHITTGSGHIRLSATTALQDVTLGGVITTTGNVSVLAGRNILDGDGEDTTVDVVASGLWLQAGNAIGQLGGSVNPVETTVTTLTARAGAGGVSLRETDTLVVDDVSVTVQQVTASAGVTPVTDVNQSDVVTGGNGSIVIRVVTGNLTLNDGLANDDNVTVSANGTGNILLEALNGSVTGNEDILSGTGHISVLAKNSLTFTTNADLTTGLTGTVELVATTGSISLSPTSHITTGSGHIRLSATTALQDVTLGGVITTTGNVSVLAGRNILDGDGEDTTVDVVASGLWLQAGNAIGQLGGSVNPVETTVTTLTARAGAGGVSLRETDTLVVDDVSVTVQQVTASAGVTPVTDVNQSDVVTGGNGSIVIRVVTGNLTLNDGLANDDNVTVSANGTGNILLEALNGSVTGNEDILSGTGHISVLAKNSLTFTTNADLTTGLTGTVELVATTGSISLSPTSHITTGSGHIRLSATTALQDVTLGGVITTTGNVSVLAGRNILDGDGEDTTVDVVASGLWLQAGNAIGQLGGSVNPVETTVTTLTARAGAGGVSLRETDTLVVDDVSVTVQQVTASAGVTPVTDVNQSDVVTGGNGSIVIRVVTGNLTLNDGLANDDNVTVSANGTGNILLEALNGSVTGNEDILSGTGHISVLAKNSLTFTTNADLTTGLTGTVELVATTGSISLSPTSHITTGSGHIRLSATTALQDVTLGGVITTTGNVSVLAGRNILDGDGEDTTVDVVASGLWLQAGNAIGQLGGSVNPVETTVTTLTARAGAGGVSLRETDTLVVDDVSVTVQQVTASAGVTPVTDVNQSDVVTGGNGSIVIRVVTGNLTLNDGLANDDNVTVSANGTGNILLEALNGSVTGNEDILSGTGHISVLAKNSLTFTTNADLTTGLTGTVELVATTGSISLSPTSHITTGSGHIRLSATTALQDVTLGGVITTTGNVSVLAGRNILDGDGEDTTVDVVASGLWLQAGNAIGQLGGSVNPVETTVTTLTARAGAGGVSLRETDTLVVDDVSVTVQQVTASAGVTPVTDVNQSDVVTGGNGSIVIRVVTGNLTLNDGLANDDNVTVSANGTGNILLEALNGSVTGNEDILSGTGHISVLAKNSLTFTTNADLTTGLTGTVELVATTGSISLSPTSHITTGSGHIRLSATTALQDVTLGGVITTTGNVSVLAGRNILDGDGEDTTVDVVASGLWLQAGNAIGQLGGSVNPVETTVTTLTARAGAGGVSLRETDTLVVDDVSVTVQQVTASAGVTPVTDVNQSDVVTGGNGSIVIRVVTGNLTLNDGLANDDNVTVSANGTGNILLEALNGSVTGNEDILSGTGHISVLAKNSLTFTTNADLTTGLTGTVELVATTGSIVLSPTSNITTGSGHIRLSATTALQDVTLGGVITTTGNVSVLAGRNILDGDNDGNTGTVDIVADGLRLQAGDGAGQFSNAVETTVTTLTASAGAGGVSVYETNGLVIGTVSVTIQQVTASAGVTPVTDAAQAGVVASGSVILNNGSGALVVSQPITVTGAGNVELGAGSGSVALNADVSTGTGHITVAAATGLTLGGGVDVTTGAPGTVSLRTAGGSLTLAGDATVVATGSSVRLAAAADVTLGNVTATNVSVIAAGGSVINAAGSTKNVTATGLRIEAGQAVGAAVRHLTTAVTNLSVLAGGTTLQGSYITEDDSVTVTGVTVTVTEVLANNTTATVTDLLQSDLTAGNNGDVILVAVNGGVTLTDGSDADGVAVSANGSGNILVSAGAGALTVNADSVSGTGHITLTASTSVSLTTGVDVTTAAAGTVSVRAQNGSLTMVGNVTVVATGSSVRLAATADVTLGNVTAANVSVVATTGSVINAAGSTKNVTATALRIEAGQAVGTAARAVTTAVTNVSVLAGGTTATGIYLGETDGVTVTGVTVTVTEVQANSTTATVTDLVQSDLAAGNNGNVILTANGLVTLTDGSDADGVAVSANGSGSVRVDAGTGALTVNADIVSGTGLITLAAQQLLTLGTDVDVTTVGGSVVVSASGLFMAGTAKVAAGAGSVRVAVTNDITVGGIVAQNVALLSTAGNILDGGDSYVNVVAGGLLVTAGNGGVGQAGNALETTVGTVSVVAGAAGVNLLETDSLVVGAVTVTVTVQQANGTTAGITDGAQSDIVSGGNVVLVTVAGSLQVTDGSDADGLGISVSGSSNIRLSAGGSGTDLNLNSDVRSGSGYITLLAANGITLGGSVDVVTGGGVVAVEAGVGSVTMADSASVVTGGGNVRVVAGGSVVIGVLDGRSGGVQDTWGHVQVVAQTGAISDAGGDGSTSVRVYGQGVSLAAAGNIGGLNAPVYRLQYTTDFVTWTELVTVSSGDTSVTYVDPVPADSRRFYRVAYGTAGVSVSLRAPQILVDRSVRLTWDVTYTGAYVPVTKALVIEGAVLAAESGAGSVAVNDVSSVTVGDVTVGYRTVGANGTLNALAADGVKSDVRVVAGNGSVYVQALGGNLTVTDGALNAGVGVSVAGGGQILLGAGGSVTVAGSVVSGSGHITVAGVQGVTMSAGTTLTTGGGEVSVTAAAGSVTVTVVSTGGGDVRVVAAGTVTVGTVDAGAGRVSVVAQAGSILDGTDAGVNVTGSAVRLQAGGSIGALNDEFVLQTALVSVSAGGVVRLANTGDLTVGSVSVTVATVGANGVVAGVTDAAQSGASTGNSLVLVNTGNLAVEAAVNVSGSGHVLLNATGTVTVNSGVTLANGSVSVVAGGALNLNAALSVTGGTADVVALGGNVVTQGITTVGGNIRISAGGSVTLGVADARNGGTQSSWGDVSVSAGGGSVTDAGADLLVNIYGRNVRVSATGTAGTLVPAVADALELDGQTLAVGGSSVNVVLAGGTTVTTVGAVSVNRVQTDGTLGASSDVGSLSGIVATTGIVVRTLNGNLAVQATITNSGSGNVLLSATGGNVSATVDVTVAGGSLSVLASGNVTLADGILLV